MNWSTREGEDQSSMVEDQYTHVETRHTFQTPNNDVETPSSRMRAARSTRTAPQHGMRITTPCPHGAYSPLFRAARKRPGPRLMKAGHKWKVYYLMFIRKLVGTK